MLKLITKAIILFVFIFIVVISLVVTSIFYGGDHFRWFGNKSEQVGIYIKDVSELVASQADKLKRTKDAVGKTVKQAGEAVKFITGNDGDDKPDNKD